MGEIAVFPFDRRLADCREIAARLVFRSRDQPARTRLLKSVQLAITVNLRSKGVDETEINKQLGLLGSGIDAAIQEILEQKRKGGAA